MIMIYEFVFKTYPYDWQALQGLLFGVHKLIRIEEIFIPRGKIVINNEKLGKKAFDKDKSKTS